MECFVIFVMVWCWCNATEGKPQNVGGNITRNFCKNHKSMNWNIFGDKNLNEKVKKQLKKLNWEVDFNIVLGLLKPTISIKTKVAKEKIKIVKSKFGGLPDLPKETEWPNLNGFPFAFIGQINLEEIQFRSEERRVGK